MNGIFITGTDTGVGKTVVTGCLARFLQERGYRVVTQKWVQTGISQNSTSDISLHLKMMKVVTNRTEHKLLEPYRFKAACSPHLASRLENRKIDRNKIIKSFKTLANKFDFVIVEGTGGLLVPYDNKSLLIDIAGDLNLPVLVVSENRVGAINHALLTLEALKSRKQKIFGILFNNLKKQNKKVLKDNPTIVKKLSGDKILGILSYSATHDRLYRNFVPIGNRIWRALNETK